MQLEDGKGKRTEEVELGDLRRDVEKKKTRAEQKGYILILWHSLRFLSL